MQKDVIITKALLSHDGCPYLAKPHTVAPTGPDKGEVPRHSV